MSRRFLTLVLLIPLVSRTTTYAEEPIEAISEVRGAGVTVDELRQKLIEPRTFSAHVDGHWVATTRQDEPLQSWNNPTRLNTAGATYLWTHDGRPAVISCVFDIKTSGNKILLTHEIHALLDLPLRGEDSGGEFWHPNQTLTLTRLTEAPELNDDARKRITQYKQIARQFTAKLLRFQTQENYQLRVLPQPLYSWSNQTGVEGHLFCIAEGTDPEVILLLESRPDESNNRQIFYGLARMTIGRVRVQRHGTDLWDVPELDPRQYSDPNRAYTTIQVPR
ncbi:MAG: hypothetical protein KDB00_20035 [Planctomycetales bacterium]|nr:hypothetical protein [Planctomycetales bacterium]